MKNTIRLTVCVLAVLALGGCFSHWQGDLAKIVISFNNAGRAAFYNPIDNATHQNLEHRIVFSNKKETVTFKHTGTETFESYVPPGNWTVWVYSWLEDDVYAAGAIEANLQIGQDNILTIPMHHAHLVRFVSNGGGAVPDQVVFNNEQAVEPPPPNRGAGDFGGWYADAELKEPYNFNNPVTKSITLYAKWEAFNISGKNLEENLKWLKGNAVDGGIYVITVDKNETIAPQELSYGDKKISITLKGDTKERTINLAGNGWLFETGSGVTLILENITLMGSPDNKFSVIMANTGGVLIMREGSLITGNTVKNDSAYSGGVTVGDKGTFIMAGGKIHGNSSVQESGGVLVWDRGSFTMNGGEISGNNSNNSNGGGVYVRNTGTFTMNGGYITKNTANFGGGGVFIGGTFTMNGGYITDNTAVLYDGGGVAVHGTFTMSGGEISGNIAKGSGGGVSVSDYATFTMTDGQIHNNTVDNTGGGVFVGKYGIFNMSGGGIYENINTTTVNTWMGGGVNVDGTFNMSAGKIYGNKAHGGGGVNVYTGTFTMTGGEIYSNTVEQCGGGVNVQSEGTFTKSGGTIYGSDADKDKKNSVTGTWNNNNNNGNGHAVSVVNEDFTAVKYHREKTAGPTDNLDSSKNANWD